MFRAHLTDVAFPGAGAHGRVVHPVDLLRLAVTWAGRVLCGLRGHVMVRHFEPQRLSLQCLTCGAHTRGWVLDARPPRRCAERSRSRHRRLMAA